MSDNIIDWLVENGGPAILLRLLFLNPGGGPDDKTRDVLVSRLLDIDGVNELFGRFDAFKTGDRDKKTLEHLIHYYGDCCIDNFFPRITDLGFRAGIPALDEKMQPVWDVFFYLNANEDEHDYCYYYKLMLQRFFFIAGYVKDEAVSSLEERLAMIHAAAAEKITDIYRDESGLPKKSKHWADVGIIKDELHPFEKSAKKPLPTVYDISALAHYGRFCADVGSLKKIDDIVEYILESKFQRIREGYGLLRVPGKNYYHACGWSPTLPFYERELRAERLNCPAALEYLKIMSRFTKTRGSEWVERCLGHFERFATERGTYIFPGEYFRWRYDERAFLSEANLELKRSAREALKRELISTLDMYEIKRRLGALCV